jgi:hypothetical protein
MRTSTEKVWHLDNRAMRNERAKERNDFRPGDNTACEEQKYCGGENDQIEPAAC